MTHQSPDENVTTTKLMQSKIRLLHISDIHFAGYWDNARGADYEGAVRDKMLADFGYMREQLGAMDGILLVGDVANWGKPDEYRKAVDFLDAAAKLVGCPPERIVCVPGNHDVDRQLQTSTHALLRHRLRTVDPESINDELRRSLSDTHLNTTLLAPFAAYNEFAFQYGCHFDTDALVFPPKTFSFGELTLHVMGINSSWICDGSEKANHDTDSLVAGTFQALRIPDDPSVVSVALCHHPRSWLRDGEELTTWMNNAHLVLTGHEHEAGIHQGERGIPLSIAAGAVNPSRGEPGWLPAYNVIELQHDSGQADIVVTIHARSWSTDGFAGFDAHPDLATLPHAYRVPLKRPRAPLGSIQVPTHPTDASVPVTSAGTHVSDVIDIEPEPIDSARQSYVRIIMRAPTEIRRTEANKLQLIQAGDPEDRSADRLIVQRATDRNLTSTLARRILERTLDA